MIKFLKNLFGMDKPSESDSSKHPLDGATRKATEAPYKVEAPEPAKCGCGRSASGLCVGLHKLTPEEWSVHADNPNKAPEAPKAKKTAKPKAPAKPKAEKVAKPKAPRKPKISVAK